jgi:hypothetical protein
MSNDLVSYSRAGDVFHYRWAARRCLRLIRPDSPIGKIVIEGSSECKKAGEYVIDVTEYSVAQNGDSQICYYQLKHTTVQGDKPFTLSDFKDTFVGFSQRFIQHKNEDTSSIAGITFTIITNRQIDDTFKQNIIAIANKQTVGTRFNTTIKEYTKLSSDDLALFCGNIRFEDGEGDYNAQRDELRTELSQLIAGSIDNSKINNLVSLVQEKVMPDSNGEIFREEVLQRFGITSERELYPAPAKWEKLDNVVVREQYNTLITNISNSQYPIIVHAVGGVGKSVFCRQLLKSLPYGSTGIAYDCFGAGSYRNRSGARHCHRDGLVQIANELSSKGLCNPLIVQDTTSAEDIMRRFLLLIESAVESLKKVVPTAQLFILIDAADNAEMAAKEFGQSCFAHELLRETMPEGCKLVLLCRTERIQLLQPPSSVLSFELTPFTELETTENLRKWYPDATDHNGIEFHRLTGANPRVQANALDAQYRTVDELLRSLGPLGSTVEQQIELQLETAVSKIRDLLPQEFKNSINSICLGLASLPPHIPVNILAKAADVEENAIRSFISDIGRSLLLSDTSVQFRDEPTETWFRNKYLADIKNYERYIDLLEPIASQSSYVAEVLPQLYLQAGQYDKLINIALSDDYLPENNPIDARNIRVQRLQFAFKAALKDNKMKDAVKLAMRAGEEMAGNQRQLDLLQNNIDLIPMMQGKEKVEEIAFKELLGSNWDGSENIYSASLLSGIGEYKGEATGYLRSSMNWLNLYFEEQRRNTKRRRSNDDGITEKDILELAYAHLNIFGLKDCLTFLLSLKPKTFTFEVVLNLTRRLIDLGRLDEVYELLHHCTREPYYVVAITSELLAIGIIPGKMDIEPCLDLLCSSKDRIENRKNYSHIDRVTPAIISFLEACLHRNLLPQKILRALRYYVPIRASQLVSESYVSRERMIYLRALAIRMALAEKTEIVIDEIIPQEFTAKEKKHVSNNEKGNFEEVVLGLMPWFLLRINNLYKKEACTLNLVNQANDTSRKAIGNRYRSRDSIPHDIAEICSSILILSDFVNQQDVSDFYHNFLHGNKAFRLPDKLELLRAVYRIPQLSVIRQELELNCREHIDSLRDESPEEIAGQYICMARAVCVESVDDARAYFDEAVNIVSKFGDEIVQRWDAVVSLAERACGAGEVSRELAYRFIRCAELVGEYVDREKYWDRNKALRVCVKMSSGIGISAFSRWRDRHIGRFEYQLESLLYELIDSDQIFPATGWALTRFFSKHQLNSILSLCLKKESSHETRQVLLDDAVSLLQVEGSDKECWEKLKEIASEHSLINHPLNLIADSFCSPKAESPETHKDYSVITSDSKEKSWDKIFNGVSIATHDGFEELMQRFKAAQAEDEFKWHERSLQTEIITRLDVASVGDFIGVILQSIHVDHYDALYILSQLPKEWANKISFKKEWPNIVFRLGQRYAKDLTNEYVFNRFNEEFCFDQNLTTKLKSGILSGLANSNNLTDADSFWGFAKFASINLDVNDAAELTDYSLSRFEIHIEDDFGDGIWGNWLEVPDDINKNIAGFIWSALGSPRSAERWNATHCVRKLAELKCIDVLDALFEWLKHDKVDAFGCKQFPFYNLHARQYLMIALARVSLEHPELLSKYSNVFSKHALSEPHVLIQKYASEVAINIERAFPGTYTKDIFDAISNVGKSKLPVQEKDYGYKTNSYWHNAGEVDTNINYHFGWDFERYWNEPLGDVFGLSSDQIENLAANVIIYEWGVTGNGGYYNDPRASLWNRHSEDTETWHDHGGYPRTDNLDFYLSYHAMLVVAAKIINKMPIIKTRDWYDDEWEEWLSRHVLTPKDGKWLSDFRDALPLKRPEWITEEKNEGWITDIKDEDFVDCLKAGHEDEFWINVKGGWHEQSNERTETYSISSALVAKETSDSLLRALDTCLDPYDYKLPYYNEDRMEIENGIFILKGWIEENSESLRLDKADPYANDIAYPPYSLGDDIVKRLGLISTNDNKLWLNKLNETSLICESWSSHKQGRNEESDQSGIKLKASLSFLKSLCTTFDCDIILDVGINREINHKYDRERSKYTKPQHKIFIISADGRLKATGTDYQLG